MKSSKEHTSEIVASSNASEEEQLESTNGLEGKTSNYLLLVNEDGPSRFKLSSSSFIDFNKEPNISWKVFDCMKNTAIFASEGFNHSCDNEFESSIRIIKPKENDIMKNEDCDKCIKHTISYIKLSEVNNAEKQKYQRQSQSSSVVHSQICISEDRISECRMDDSIQKISAEVDGNMELNNQNVNFQLEYSKVFKITKIFNIVDRCYTREVRKDNKMKSILRAIRKDIKQDFYVCTAYDFNRLYREEGYFIDCLQIYSSTVFGESPTIREIIILGSLVAYNHILKYVETQYRDDILCFSEFITYKNLLSKIHSTLYNYSERSLHRLAKLSEFESIIRKHKLIIEKKEFTKETLYFYNRILRIFHIPPHNGLLISD